MIIIMLTSQLLRTTGKATHTATGVTVTDHDHADPFDTTRHHYRFQLDWPDAPGRASFNEGHHKLAALKLRLQRANIPTDSGWTTA